MMRLGVSRFGDDGIEGAADSSSSEARGRDAGRVDRDSLIFVRRALLLPLLLLLLQDGEANDHLRRDGVDGTFIMLVLFMIVLCDAWVCS